MNTGMARQPISAWLTLAISSHRIISRVDALRTIDLNVPRLLHAGGGGPWGSSPPAPFRIARRPFNNNIRSSIARDDADDAVESYRPRRRFAPPAFPPPKNGADVRATEKQVCETVRMLDGLKLGAGERERRPSPPPPTRRSSGRQEQERQSMSKRPRRKSAATRKDVAAPSPPPADAIAAPSSGRGGPTRDPAARPRARPARGDPRAGPSSPGPSSGGGRRPGPVDRPAGRRPPRDAGGRGRGDRDPDDGDGDGGGGDPTGPGAPAFSGPSSSSPDPDAPAPFAGIPRLSAAAADALRRAFGEGGDPASAPEPTPIQSVAIPHLFFPPNPSALLHAPTGSGKTIAYLLPITETLWREVEDRGGDDMANGVALVLLPTRELAAQVAGVASVLAPPGMVRLVPRPMDLMSSWNRGVDRGEEYEYLERLGEDDGNDGERGYKSGREYQPRILVGSARAIGASLFGDAKMPGTPTSKPEGKRLLSSVRWLVMDEVDRLLGVEKSRSDRKPRRHEKPAASLAAAVARLTVGRAQVVAASATVGRPLRRELSRVLGLRSSECPETLRGGGDAARLGREMAGDERHVGRAVRIPDAVRNYVLPVDGSTTGSLLTSAALACGAVLSGSSGRRVLLVLTRNCDVKVHNALGALRHFGIRPEPRSLLDALEADGTDRLVEAHRRVTGVEGVGGARGRDAGRRGPDVPQGEDGGYLLVTHEDNVRGLHLDGLDAVVVVGRPGGPDEYTHIAGRVGRAGRLGSVLNIVSFEQAAALASWTMMLGVNFLPVDESEIATLLDE
jgi:hypothetical protein